MIIKSENYTDLKGTIKIWSPVLLNYETTLTGHNDTVTDLIILKNGYLASASFDSTIRVWDNSYSSTVVEAFSEEVLVLKSFQNGSLLSSSLDTTLKTWDTDTFILNQTIYK